MSQMGYSIKVVAQLTGLTSHVIRIWEKRYAAVTPGRTSTNRRLYSDEEIERLTLLRRATEAGHSIRNVASVSTDQLRKLVGPERESSDAAPIASASSGAVSAVSAVSQRLADALQAIRQLDGAGLDRILTKASVDLSQPALIQDLIAPLIEQVGDLWERGELKIAHEHIASAGIRTFVGNFMRQHSAPGFAPALIVTTPAGQVHELGAILAAAEANNHGWQVCYLGASLPAEEIAAAAAQQNAQAVALSIVYPADDPHLASELSRLRKLLPSTILLIGGRAAPSYQIALHQVGAILCRSIAEFGTQLAKLRQRHHH